MNKGKRNPAQNALRVVEQAIGEPLKAPRTKKVVEIATRKSPEKNSAAVALGRLGGLKGGKARAAKLSDTRRREIASKAARKRWEQKEPTQ
jgi:hypothetical protein